MTAPITTRYVIAFVAMSIATVIASVTVLLARPSDPLPALAMILGFATSTLAGIMAFLKGQETHLIVNSRMDEFKALIEDAANKAAVAAFQRGLALGKDAGAASADARTDTLAHQENRP